MNYKEIIETLELTKSRLLLHLPQRLRPFFREISSETVRSLFIYGPRGVGKTTFLLNAIQDKNYLYLSADHPMVAGLDLYNFASFAFREGFEGIVIDEIHFANNWSTHLKALYDDYPDRSILVSDSSSLILQKGVADLSRRFVSQRIPLLSFREYIYLRTELLLEPISLFSFDSQLFKTIQQVNVLKLFKEYLGEGIRPFFSEGAYCRRMEGVLHKTIYSDIPFYVPSIRDNHLRLMNGIVTHLLQSSIPTINMAKMCAEWAVSKEKLYELLYVMEHCELIRIVHKAGKQRKYSKGAKIFFADPSFYPCFNGELGNCREAFAVFSLQERYKVYASKKETECDYVVDGYKIEIGGKNKKRKGADLVLRDDIDLPVGDSIPLWMAGLVF